MNRPGALVLLMSLPLTAEAAMAQPLGIFRWQLQPFCNVLTFVVTQSGSVYTLDGFDDQCGAPARAPASGTAVPNPNGTVALGINVVVPPAGVPLHVAADISMTTFGGVWRDSAGNAGTFPLTPGAGTGGSPRPAVPPRPVIPASFTLQIDGGFAARSEVAPTGLIPVQGPGSRMMWHPGKAAFRAGTVNGPLWDDVNVGVHSVAIGLNSAAIGPYSVAFGLENAAIRTAAVAMGSFSIAEAIQSVAIGSRATAGGLKSVVLGTNALTTAAAAGSFVYGDNSTTNFVTSSAPNEFVVRAAGGVAFFTNPALTTGAGLAINGSQWLQLSDVNAKEAFRDLDRDDLLVRLAQMPVREWSYKAQGPSIRHVGPTAQDFHAAFGLGEDPLRIGTVDAAGIALAAVQALEARTRAENDALRAEVEALKRALAALMTAPR
jgi:hypothetical protein